MRVLLLLLPLPRSLVMAPVAEAGQRDPDILDPSPPGVLRIMIAVCLQSNEFIEIESDVQI